MAMKTTQGWGWLAAGVLALGLNGFYHDGGLGIAHRIVDRVADRVTEGSEFLANLASEHADRFAEQANVVVVRNETASCRLATAMARVQNRIAQSQVGWAHAEAMTARQEAAMARVEAEQARIEAQTIRVQVATDVFRPMMVQAMKVPVICPRVRVSVPRVPMVRIPAPVVHVEVGGSPI
jgi:hypothetical protein